MRQPCPAACLLLFLILSIAPPLQARADQPLPVQAHGVVGVEDAHLTPEWWVARLPQADRVLLDRAGVNRQNARLQQLDDSMYDLRKLPATLSRPQVGAWIESSSPPYSRPLYDVAGAPVPGSVVDAMRRNMQVDQVPETRTTRFGLVVHRADLRRFPSALRVFSTRAETDIDRFQESALFPGTPVAIAHESGDGQWMFVVSPRYAAWIEKRHVAEGSAQSSKEQVFGYVDRAPYRVITGATERTVSTREQPPFSQLQLDMGVRVPLADHPADQLVNGQHPYTAHVIQLPLRGTDGALSFAPALLPKRADSGPDYLPLTPANLINQSFKFLGERYGWGHAYDARDCSGFVSEIYRSLGVEVPRNTSDQAVSPALDHTLFDENDSRDKRQAAVANLQVGDLVYIPGHVMMVIGQIEGNPYVIHDTNGGSMRAPDGSIRRLGLNGVSVTPLLPMMFNDRDSYVDRMTSIVRVAGTGRE
ncbi:MAG: SH3 domain-containing protein [Pseudomonadota bacterium]|nr:SH3 domain-containing protein [Pseudomonadota bacterium]